MQMHFPRAALFALALCAPLAHAQAEDPLDLKIRNGWAVAAQQDTPIAARSNKASYPILTSTDAAQTWQYANSGNWISGFFPSSLWMLQAQDATQGWDTRAAAWTTGMGNQASNTGTHDVGFMVFTPFGNGYRMTGNASYLQTIQTTANSLSSRYDPDVGAVRSWGSISDTTNFQVIIDNMMNIELMFWASAHGGSSTLYDRARSHAIKTMQNHVRPDGSSYHLVVYSPTTGAVKSRSTVQGYSDSSTWARGQAWGIYGFTMTYRFTGEQQFLDTARRMADWFLGHLPADKVPFWDFNDPAIPNAPRDSSAAAIAASGLMELSLLETDATRATTYRNAAKSLLGAVLSPPYLATLGSPSNTQALLLQSSYHKNEGLYNQGTGWGDYYLLEAMLRARRLPPGLAPLATLGVTASSAQAGNPATGATDNNTATRWSAQGDGQWLRIDLGAGALVHKVGVSFYLGDQRSARFDIETSTDGLAWTPRWQGRSSGQTAGMEYYDIPDASTRYVRIVGHGSTASDWNSVTEIAAF